MIHFNPGSHNPDLSRNHKVLEELTSLVEVTERAAVIPRILSPEELKQAEEAHRFDQLSDFDPMYGNDDFEEEE